MELDKETRAWIILACIITGAGIGLIIDQLEDLSETQYTAQVNTRLAFNFSKEYRLEHKEAIMVNPPQVIYCYYYQFRDILTQGKYHVLYSDTYKIWIYDPEEGTAYIYQLKIKENGFMQYGWEHR